jgi:hypothetical protein
MSQVMQERSGATLGGDRDPAPSRHRRRLAAMIVVLGLLLGVAAGWTAFSLISQAPPDAQARSLAAQQARWDAAAERHAALEAETRGRTADRLRWEAQADRYAPGWRN